MKIIISGGGTGGHIYPGIAIAHELKRQNPDTEILFVGAKGKMEMEKVPKAGFEIVGLPIRGIQRKLSLKNLVAPFRLLLSLWQARAIVHRFQPDVVVGTGGYASAALMQAAVWAGIPTLIQEQNGYAGLTNKILAKKVSKICVAYPDMERYFPQEKIVFTGNPVRQDLNQLSERKAAAYAHFGFSPEKKTIVVMGGSLGAKTLNMSFIAGARQLLEAGHQLIWQTGKLYLEQVKAATSELAQTGLYINDFMYNMADIYAIADVAVMRAGALSISELCLTEKPAILVPSPNVAEDHQNKNAMALVEKKAAWRVSDAEAEEKLIPTLLDLLAQTQEQQLLKTNIRTFARPKAAQHIVREIKQLIE